MRREIRWSVTASVVLWAAVIATVLMPHAASAATSSSNAVGNGTTRFSSGESAAKLGECSPMLDGASPEMAGPFSEAPNATTGDLIVVSPSLVELKARPGIERYWCPIRISNRRKKPTAFELTALGLVGSSSDGMQTRYLQPDAPEWKQTAGPWLALPPTITMKTREFMTVMAVITIPKDAKAGGHFAAVSVHPRDADIRLPKGGAQTPAMGSTVESRIAVPILVTVPGTASPDLKITKATAPDIVWSREPWKLNTTVQNTGTVHLQPTGTVQVKSIFGNVVARFPIQGRIVLPSGSSAARVTWRKPPWFGYYRVTVKMGAKGHTGTLDSTTLTFWALPPWWVLLIAAMLPVDLLMLRRIIRRRQAPSLDDDVLDDDVLEDDTLNDDVLDDD